MCDLLFVKGDGWKSEREIRLLVGLIRFGGRFSYAV